MPLAIILAAVRLPAINPLPTQFVVDFWDTKTGHRVVKTPALGGLHHEYSLVKEAA